MFLWKCCFFWQNQASIINRQCMLTWVRNKIKNSKLSVIDRFEQGSFSKQNLVGNTHRWILHIVFNFSDKLYAIKKKVLKQSLTNISFVSHSFPLMFSRNSPCFNGSRSSTFPGVNMKLRTSPLSLIIRCNLNPKNHPIEHFHARQVPQMSYE